MRFKQRGVTVIELIIAIGFAITVAVLGGLGYVAVHFLAKYW